MIRIWFMMLWSILLSSSLVYAADEGAAADTKNEAAQEENAMLSADFDSAPTHIKSDTLTLKSKARQFTYKDNVIVTQGDLKITSKVLVGVYDEQNQIITLTAEGDVVITKGPGIHATGSKAHYIKSNETMTLTGNPEVTQEKSTLAADKIIVFLKEDRSTAEGNVRVKMVQDKKESKESSVKNIKKAIN